jgi:hypothetical protein
MEYIIEQVTWEDNWKLCCSLGMQPLTFDSLDNMQCLINILNGLYRIRVETKLKPRYKCIPGTMTNIYNTGYRRRTESTLFWTGGFRNKFTNMFTWCRRHNSTTFGASRINDTGNYYFSENHELSNATNDNYCSKFGFLFDEGILYCWELRDDMRLICESTATVTYSDLVNMTSFSVCLAYQRVLICF